MCGRSTNCQWNQLFFQFCNDNLETSEIGFLTSMIIIQTQQMLITIFIFCKKKWLRFKSAITKQPKKRTRGLGVGGALITGDNLCVITICNLKKNFHTAIILKASPQISICSPFMCFVSLPLALISANCQSYLQLSIFFSFFTGLGCLQSENAKLWLVRVTNSFPSTCQKSGNACLWYLAFIFRGKTTISIGNS